jgi:hypothetical protein
MQHFEHETSGTAPGLRELACAPRRHESWKSEVTRLLDLHPSLLLKSSAGRSESSLDLSVVELSLVASGHGCSLFASTHASKGDGVVSFVRVAPADFSDKTRILLALIREDRVNTHFIEKPLAELPGVMAVVITVVWNAIKRGENEISRLDADK